MSNHIQVQFTDHHQYLVDVVSKLQGWLNDYAAITTMRLLDLQESEWGARGVLFEIGVFSAKYFSILLRSGARNGDSVFGLDTFQWIPVSVVRERISVVLSDAHYNLISSPSTALTSRDLLARFDGASARFISVDGSHDCDDVVWDLRLAEDLLSSDGIVAVDDFLNPITLGVNNGVNRFYETPRGIVPFAYLDNKLFLCRPHRAEFYKAALEGFAEANPAEPLSKAFLERRAQARHAVEQPLWGWKLLTFG